MVRFSNFLEPQAQSSFSWYKRSEFGTRANIFFSTASISDVFCAFLAVSKARAPQRISAGLAFQTAAILKMDGIGGKSSRAWVFILEGHAKIIGGFPSFWIIQNFPDSAEFLADAERTIVIRRSQKDC